MLVEVFRLRLESVEYHINNNTTEYIINRTRQKAKPAGHQAKLITVLEGGQTLSGKCTYITDDNRKQNGVERRTPRMKSTTDQ